MQLLKLKNIGFALVLCASALVIFSCGEDEEPPSNECLTESLTYGNFAQDFLNQTCATANCHGGTATSTSFAMNDYESAKAAVDFGKIIGAINHESGFSNMPKGEKNKLDDCSIEKMTAWINDGAPE